MDERPATDDRARAWAQYLGAFQRLDAIRRGAAQTAAAEAATVTAAREHLPVVQAQLALQSDRMFEIAARVGAPPPVTQPGPAQRRAADDRVAGGPADILAAVRGARRTADMIDSTLSRMTETRGGVLRWIGIGVVAGLTIALIILSAVGW